MSDWKQLPNLKLLRKKAELSNESEEHILTEKYLTIKREENNEEDSDEEFLEKLKKENREIEQRLISLDEKQKPESLIEIDSMTFDPQSAKSMKQPIKKLSYRKNQTPRSTKKKRLPHSESKPENSFLKQDKLKQLEIRLKGTMSTIQHLESTIAEKDSAISRLTADLEFFKKKAVHDSESKPEIIQRPALSESTIITRKCKEQEKQIQVYEDTIKELKRRNTRLEMLNEQLNTKYIETQKHQDMQASETEKQSNKITF